MMKQIEFDTQKSKREDAKTFQGFKRNMLIITRFILIEWQNLNRPKETWPLLLQSTFIGKACEIHWAYYCTRV